MMERNDGAVLDATGSDRSAFRIYDQLYPKEVGGLIRRGAQEVVGNRRLF